MRPTRTVFTLWIAMLVFTPCQAREQPAESPSVANQPAPIRVGMKVGGWTVRQLVSAPSRVRVIMENPAGERVVFWVRGTPEPRSPFAVEGAGFGYEKTDVPFESFSAAGHELAGIINASLRKTKGDFTSLFALSEIREERRRARGGGVRADIASFGGLAAGTKLGDTWTVRKVEVEHDHVNVIAADATKREITFGIGAKRNPPGLFDTESLRIYYAPTEIPPSDFRAAGEELSRVLSRVKDSAMLLHTTLQRAGRGDGPGKLPEEAAKLLRSLEGRWKVTELEYGAELERPVATSSETVLRTLVSDGSVLQEEPASSEFHRMTLVGFSPHEHSWWLFSVGRALSPFLAYGERGTDRDLPAIVFWREMQAEGGIPVQQLGAASSEGGAPRASDDVAPPGSSRVVLRLLNRDRNVFEVYEVGPDGRERLTSSRAYERIAATSR